MSWAELHAAWRGFLDAAKIDDTAPAPVTGFNIRPTQQVQVALQENGRVLLTTARWWFVPSWHRGTVTDWKQTTFNARVETAAEKPTFRQAWQTGRCLIPARGYYEWTGEKSAKQPWHIAPRINAPVFFMAGLQSRLDDGLRTCTILTRPAIPQISHIHSRMPVILSDDQLNSWLGGDDFDGASGDQWEGRMNAHMVRPFGIHDDGPELIEPFEPPQQLGFGF